MGEPGHHRLLQGWRDGTVALVEDVGDGQVVGHDRPVHRLEVVVQGVAHAAHRVDHEGQALVVERVAPVGPPEGLGIGRRALGGQHDAVALGHLDGHQHALAVAVLHAVQAATALRWHRGRVEHDVADPRPQAGHHAGHHQPARRVGHHHDGIVQPRGFDVGQDRGHLVVDGEGGQVGRLVVAAGQVDGQGGLVEVGDESVPESGGAAAAVDEQVGHVAAPTAPGVDIRRTLASADEPSRFPAPAWPPASAPSRGRDPGTAARPTSPALRRSRPSRRLRARDSPWPGRPRPPACRR